MEFKMPKMPLGLCNTKLSISDKPKNIENNMEGLWGTQDVYTVWERTHVTQTYQLIIYKNHVQ